LREQTNDGIDPIEKRRADRAAAAAEQSKAAARAKTFDQSFEEYIAAHRARWSPKYAAGWEISIRRYASPVIGKLPIGEIDTPLVVKVLKPIWTTKTPTARNVRANVRAVLAAAKVEGLHLFAAAALRLWRDGVKLGLF